MTTTTVRYLVQYRARYPHEWRDTIHEEITTPERALALADLRRRTSPMRDLEFRAIKRTVSEEELTRA